MSDSLQNCRSSDVPHSGPSILKVVTHLIDWRIAYGTFVSHFLPSFSIFSLLLSSFLFTTGAPPMGGRGGRVAARGGRMPMGPMGPMDMGYGAPPPGFPNPAAGFAGEKRFM